MKKGDFVLMTVFGVLLVFVIAIFVFRPKAVNCVVYENRNEIASLTEQGRDYGWETHA
jgi:hypothetical protein